MIVFLHAMRPASDRVDSLPDTIPESPRACDRHLFQKELSYKFIQQKTSKPRERILFFNTDPMQEQAYKILSMKRPVLLIGTEGETEFVRAHILIRSLDKRRTHDFQADSWSANLN